LAGGKGHVYRPLSAVAWAVLVLATLGGCAAQPVTESARGNLFARGLDDIGELYLEPVSTRRVALAGAARLTRLDGELGVSDSLGTGAGGALAVAYGGRDISLYTIPADNANRAWGELLTNVIATAKQVSPKLAAQSDEAIDKAIFDGMTGALDRFSHYSTPEVARDQRAQRDGFGGIGITFDNTDDTFKVTALTPDGPAERAGIQIEDRILAIDGVLTTGRTREEVVHQLRGRPGTPIAVRVLRAADNQIRPLQLHRAFVVSPSVTMRRDGDIAIFRISIFNHSTAQRMAATLAEAEQQSGGHLAGIVLDLRDNPGGLLDQAVEFADIFIKDGPIVATTGRNPASRQYFAASGRSAAPLLPIIVLINGASASAAEIVAAALQDAGRALVIGSSSFGKGTVQTVLPLPNKGDLVLTWARLVTPSGYLLQSHGVVPTVCTADLQDNQGALDVGLQRVNAEAQSGGPALRARANLNERGWAELRHACPGRRNRPAVDLSLAEHVLADPKLYAAAVHALPSEAHVARGGPDGAPPDPALTEANRALSSRAH
jgi:carboxyl-terminal processing protease